MATCVGLAMVTFLLWMVNAKTSSCIVRILVGNRNGSILRSVGSNSMPLLVLYFKAGVACCLPTCAQGCSFPVMGDFCFGFGVLRAFWCLLGVLCIWGVLVLLGSLLCTRLGFLRCASCWTRPMGGGRWGHYLCNLWEEYLKFIKLPSSILEFMGIFGYGSQKC